MSHSTWPHRLMARTTPFHGVNRGSIPLGAAMNLRKDYQAALALRMEGKTYGEIKQTFGIPKSTLSSWFSGLKVSDKAKAILKSKEKNGYYKLVEFNKIRTEKIKEENESIRTKYKYQIKKLNRRDLMILGAALYWGEGYKNFGSLKRNSYPYLCFGNSDPEMVTTFILFLEKIIGITKDRIRCQVMIYPNSTPEDAVNYWQNLTQIPKKNFHYHVALSKASQGKRPNSLLPYGTLQLRVSKRQHFFKVRGLIDGIIEASK